MEKVRVRFAPSPTGALHIGGIRTALFNYLFAKKTQGQLILRIEDTDQSRLVKGAERYIFDALTWCNIIPDESPFHGGDYGPYRQSERKDIYQKYIVNLIKEDKAYYAFDTPQELDNMRAQLRSSRVLNPQYDTMTRKTMKNSLTLPKEEMQRRILSGEPYVIRIKIPSKKQIRLYDKIRGWIKVNSEILDDKVLMKSDGMPTYHLANVIDDYLMKVTHVIRGEEWLPSAPLHILLYEYFGWEKTMPTFVHLPLILKTDGNGKLSKRSAEKEGIPIIPIAWQDEIENSKGFKENGFSSEAFINFLAFLGWNPGTDEEIFNMKDLITAFSIENINKAGTKFDFEKAKWFNKEHVKKTSSKILAAELCKQLKEQHHITCDLPKAVDIINLLKGRVTFEKEFVTSSLILFDYPKRYDEKIIKKKWNQDTSKALTLFAEKLKNSDIKTEEDINALFQTTLENNGYSPNQFMQTLRLSLTGEGSGPYLMTIIRIIGAHACAKRIEKAISEISLLN